MKEGRQEYFLLGLKGREPKKNVPRLLTNIVGSALATCATKESCTKRLFSYCRSFFQSVCVLGYCILPLNMALVACRLILLAKHTTALFIVRFVVVILGFAWSTFGK